MLGTMAAFGHSRAAVDLRGVALTGFAAWWVRRTYYLFQMPRWDTRLRIALDWTVSLFFRPDLTKVDLAPERQQEWRNCPAGVAVTSSIPERADHESRGGAEGVGDGEADRHRRHGDREPADDDGQRQEDDQGERHRSGEDLPGGIAGDEHAGTDHGVHELSSALRAGVCLVHIGPGPAAG